VGLATPKTNPDAGNSLTPTLSQRERVHEGNPIFIIGAPNPLPEGEGGRRPGEGI